MNLSGKINLAALSGTAIITGKRGQPVFCIDIETANLFKSDKGAVYLDIVCFENANKQYSDYSIKQSLPKEKRTDQQPFIGNLSVMVAKEASAPQMEADDLIGTPDSELPF